MKNTNTSLMSVKEKPQKFCFATHDAHEVQLVGDFTNWEEKPIRLRQEPGGLWQTSVRLPPGTHYYRFLVDGQWRDDPDCPLFVPNPFGGHNAVRQVN